MTLLSISHPGGHEASQDDLLDRVPTPRLCLTPTEPISSPVQHHRWDRNVRQYKRLRRGSKKSEILHWKGGRRDGRRTFLTCELTRFRVLSQAQSIGPEFSKSYGLEPLSEGSLYTGMMTIANLQWKKNALESAHEELSNPGTTGGNVLGVREDDSALVQQPIYAELDSGPNYPAQRTVVVVDGVRDEERVVGSWRRVRGRRGEGEGRSRPADEQREQRSERKRFRL